MEKEIRALIEQFGNLSREKEFHPGTSIISTGYQWLEPLDMVSLIQAVLAGQYAAGIKTRQFEKFLSVKFFPNRASALMTNSGSSANLIAVSSLTSPKMKELGYEPLKPGDWVLTVAGGFPTTVAPIIQNKLIPVFVDIKPTTLNVEPLSVQQALWDHPKIKAVILAHTLGNPYRADIIGEMCKKKNIPLIEDCCDALGALIGDQPVGTFGQLATCSFYPAHHISTGEGGAVIAENPKLRRINASFRDWGRDCWCDPGCDNTCGKRFAWDFGSLPPGYDHKYIYTHLGYNLKASEFQGSLGLTQLKLANQVIQARRDNYAYMAQALSEVEGITVIKRTSETSPSWFGFPLLCDDHLDRNKLTQFLESKGIRTRLVFAGNLTHHPAFKDQDFRVAEYLNGTDTVMNKAFWIGCHPGLTGTQMDYMVEMIKEGIAR